MDWFEKLTGFTEKSYTETKENLYIKDNKLYSKINHKCYDIGEFKIISLKDLRSQTKRNNTNNKNKVEVIRADVKDLLCDKKNHNAVFQVASQFNCLEMINENITPERGVTRYAYDLTQGPICSIAAGAATIFRNYYVDTNGQEGQTELNQLNTLKGITKFLENVIGVDYKNLIEVKNGYAFITEDKLELINEYLLNNEKESIKELLEIGVHSGIEVTQNIQTDKMLVTQAFCSALPVSYNLNINDKELWKPFASLILEAAYEATLLTAVKNKNYTNKVFLTLLGGGAFGNNESWIINAIKSSLKNTENYGLDIKIVSYDQPSKSLKVFNKI